MSHFETLNKINVNDKAEKKNGLTYLSWAFAWAEVKKVYPDATYNIRKFDGGLPYVFDPKTGYMVFTDTTIEGITHEMWLPVMDGANAAMKDVPYQYQVSQWQNGKKVIVTKDCVAADMFDINKTIMRCLTKNLAMFGLGLYIYAGEDLPEVDTEPVDKPKPPIVPPTMTYTCQPEELERRKKEIVAVVKAHKRTQAEYEAIRATITDTPLKDMTTQEYDDYLAKVTAKLNVL